MWDVSTVRNKKIWHEALHLSRLEHAQLDHHQGAFVAPTIRLFWFGSLYLFRHLSRNPLPQMPGHWNLWQWLSLKHSIGNISDVPRAEGVKIIIFFGASQQLVQVIQQRSYCVQCYTRDKMKLKPEASPRYRRIRSQPVRSDTVTVDMFVLDVSALQTAFCMRYCTVLLVKPDATFWHSHSKKEARLSALAQGGVGQNWRWSIQCKWWC
jgi:hypothetical protein